MDLNDRIRIDAIARMRHQRAPPAPDPCARSRAVASARHHRAGRGRDQTQLNFIDNRLRDILSSRDRWTQGSGSATRDDRSDIAESLRMMAICAERGEERPAGCEATSCR